MITKELIKIPLNADTKEEALEQLAAIAHKEGKVSDEEAYIQAVLKREEEYSTAVGFHVAIPHGKTDAVKEAFFMYGRVDSIDWAALDGEPVNHVFLIGVPEKEAGNTHLQILAKLSRKLMKADFRDALSASQDADGVLQVLKDNELI